MGRRQAARARVFGRVFVTLLAGGVIMALLALFQEVSGNGRVLWVSDEPVMRGRVSGPFVNPNHLACWLEMIIPAAAAYAWVLARRLRRRIVQSVESSERLGLRPRRAWAGALIASQRRLVVPFLAAAAVALMLTAHLGTQSRGGTAALAGRTGRDCGRDPRPALSRRRSGRAPAGLPAGVVALPLLRRCAVRIALLDACRRQAIAVSTRST